MDIPFWENTYKNDSVSTFGIKPVFEDEHPGIKKHMHASNTIVARRKA